ncbi:MAG: hypothetical protein RJA07_2381 [Bacteroidota bacterium]|jgi:hypothetical protein
MIIKNLTRKSNTTQLIQYIFAGDGKLSNEKFKPIVIRHNIRSRSIAGYVKEFEANELLRLHHRVDNVKINHTILSFSNLDKEHISEKMLKDIAKKYISTRGKDNIYIGTAHYDGDHIHLHLISSSVKYLTGKSDRISKQEFQQLKISMDAYQKDKYPELIHSLPEHGKQKNRMIENVISENIKNDRTGSDKQSLLKLLQTTFQSSKSSEHFLSQLKEQGHKPYYRNDKLTGLLFNERKFRLNRLGFDEKKLQELDLKNEREQKELQELENLRKGQPITRNIKIEPNEKSISRNEIENDRSER